MQNPKPSPLGQEVTTVDEQAVRELLLAACAEAFGIPRDEIHEATEINELFLGEAQAMIENGLAQSGVDLFANSETWLRWRTVGDAIASTHTPRWRRALVAAS